MLVTYTRYPRTLELVSIGVLNSRQVNSASGKVIWHYWMFKRSWPRRRFVLFVWLVGWFLNILVNYKVIWRRGPKTERLTILHAATHETELRDHDFCLSRCPGGGMVGLAFFQYFMDSLKTDSTGVSASPRRAILCNEGHGLHFA